MRELIIVSLERRWKSYLKIDGDYYEGYTSNYIRVKVDSDKDLVGHSIADIHANEGDYLIAKVGR